MCQYGSVVCHLSTAIVYQGRFNLRESLQDLSQSSLKQSMKENVSVCALMVALSQIMKLQIQSVTIN